MYYRHLIFVINTVYRKYVIMKLQSVTKFDYINELNTYRYTQELYKHTQLDLT